MKTLQSQNLCFFPMDSNNTFIKRDITSPKYMAGTLYGGLMPSEIYTYDEIKEKYPEIKEVELSSKELIKEQA